MSPDAANDLLPLRDVALVHVSRALRALQKPDTTGVHTARKQIKRLRAWARLCRGALGEDYVAINRLLRDAGRALSSRRDDDVVLETLLHLRRTRAISSADYRLLKRLLSPPRHAHPQLDARHGTRWIDAAGAYIECCQLPHDLKQLHRCLQRQQRRCRRQWRHLGKHPNAEALHDWRKQVKYLGYQCALVSTLLPAATDDVPALRAVGEILGQHHDLDGLARRLEQMNIPLDDRAEADAARRTLRAAIDEQQRRLTAQAMAQGAALFGTRRRS